MTPQGGRGGRPGVLTEQNIAVRNPHPGQISHVRIPGVQKSIFYHFYSNRQTLPWVGEENAVPTQGKNVRCCGVDPPPLGHHDDRCIIVNKKDMIHISGKRCLGASIFILVGQYRSSKISIWVAQHYSLNNSDMSSACDQGPKYFLAVIYACVVARLGCCLWLHRNSLAVHQWHWLDLPVRGATFLKNPHPGQISHVRIPGVQKSIFYHFYSNRQTLPWVGEENAVPTQGKNVRCCGVDPPPLGHHDDRCIIVNKKDMIHISGKRCLGASIFILVGQYRSSKISIWVAQHYSLNNSDMSSACDQGPKYFLAVIYACVVARLGCCLWLHRNSLAVHQWHWLDLPVRGATFLKKLSLMPWSDMVTCEQKKIQEETSPLECGQLTTTTNDT